MGGTSDHVLDEITMSWCVNDGDIVVWSVELTQGGVNGDTNAFAAALAAVLSSRVSACVGCVSV